ncbi:MAG: hypothetical protein F7C81_06365 [Desulfurococcales archaeon]|nr:hypothetical protein [Desulfurococcales archaeon]MEB3779656.1 hypothetical protein [Desulfurococcales archaeon]
MKVRILASDSMGVRSIATVVEMCGLVVGLDLGASIAPRRYGLPPHDIELRRLEKALDDASRWIRESHVITVTHYHYDHYMANEPELYRGKLLLVKHPTENINMSQRMRSYRFLKKNGVEEIARVEYGDGRRFNIEGVTIELSPPVWHGEPGTKVGKVLMVRVACEEGVVVYTSDVQGPVDEEALRILKEWSRPEIDLMIIGGPPTYFAGYKVPVRAVEQGLKGLLRVINEVRPRRIIVDHHLLRDIRYLEKIEAHIREAERLGIKLETAAEYMGRPIEQLEARRKELWGRR